MGRTDLIGRGAQRILALSTRRNSPVRSCIGLAGKTGTKPFRIFTGSGHTENGTHSRCRPLGEITSSNIPVLARET